MQSVTQHAHPLSVTLRESTYPVHKRGQGVPCFVVGIGTLMERTLPEAFFEQFSVYSSDLYWVSTENNKKIFQTLDMDMILDDIHACVTQLALTHCMIVAHSAFGIVALEFAKKYPAIASSFLIIGTPVNSSPSVAAQNNAIFEQKADAKRKAIDRERQAQGAPIDLSARERFLYHYTYTKAPRYWHIPDVDCTYLWENLEPPVEDFFVNILPKVNVLKHVHHIKEPIFVASGVSDYDCCPWLWAYIPHPPPRMMVSLFKESGHWPHMEEGALFCERVCKWRQMLAEGADCARAYKG